MPTITVKLDTQRAARLTRWARHRKVLSRRRMVAFRTTFSTGELEHAALQ
jgi:hypothetical protein